MSKYYLGLLNFVQDSTSSVSGVYTVAWMHLHNMAIVERVMTENTNVLSFT